MSQPGLFYILALISAQCLTYGCGPTAELLSTHTPPPFSLSPIPVVSHVSLFNVPRLLQHVFFPTPQSSADCWHSQLSNLFRACCVMASSKGCCSLFFFWFGFVSSDFRLQPSRQLGCLISAPSSE